MQKPPVENDLWAALDAVIGVEIGHRPKAQMYQLLVDGIEFAQRRDDDHFMENAHPPCKGAGRWDKPED